MKKVILLTTFVFTGLLGYSQCNFDNGGGDNNWFTATNWTGLGCDDNGILPGGESVPAADDDVTITGYSVNIASAGALAASVTVQGDNLVDIGLLTISASGTLTVSGDITLNDNTLNANDGTLTISGGTVTVNSPGVIDVQAGGVLNISSGNLVLHTATAAIAATGTWNATGGTVHFSRSTDDTQAIDVALDYPNIEIDGGRDVTVNATITNVNDLTITNGSELIIANTRALSGSGTLVMDANTDLTIEGDANFPSGYTGTLDATSTVTFNKNNTESMANPTSIVFGNVVINSSGADLTSTGASNSVNTLLDVDAGTVQFTNSNWNGDGTATIDVANGATVQYNAGLHFPDSYSTYIFGASSTVIFNGVNQNVSRAAGDDITFGNLTIQGGSGTKTLLDDITVAGDLLVSTSTTFDTDQDFQITGGTGNVTVTDGTLIIGNGDLPTFTGGYDFDATSTEVIFNDLDGAQSVSNDTHVFDNLTINGGNTKTVDDNITVQGTLDIDGTTVTLDANTNAIDGDFTFNIGAGDFLETSAAVPFGGTVATGTIDATSTTTYNGGAQEVEALDYGNLIIDQAGIKTLQGNSSPTGDVTISNTATFDIETYAFTGAGGKTLDINDDCRLALSGAANFPTGFR